MGVGSGSGAASAAAEREAGGSASQARPFARHADEPGTSFLAASVACCAVRGCGERLRCLGAGAGACTTSLGWATADELQSSRSSLAPVGVSAKSVRAGSRGGQCACVLNVGGT